MMQKLQNVKFIKIWDPKFGFQTGSKELQVFGRVPNGSNGFKRVPRGYKGFQDFQGVPEDSKGYKRFQMVQRVAKGSKFP